MKLKTKVLLYGLTLYMFGGLAVEYKSAWFGIFPLATMILGYFIGDTTINKHNKKNTNKGG